MGGGGGRTRIGDVPEEDLDNLLVVHRDPLAGDPAAATLALPLLLALILGRDLLRLPDEPVPVVGISAERRAHRQLALAPLDAAAAAAAASGEYARTTLVGELLLDPGDVPDLAQEVGEHVLGRDADVNVVLCEVLAARSGGMQVSQRASARSGRSGLLLTYRRPSRKDGR